MDVGATGTGSPNLVNPVIRPAVAPGASASLSSAIPGLNEDGVATFLQDLASPQISDLLNLIEQTRLAQDPLVLEGLIRTAASAVNARELSNAIAAITELVALNPERGAQLVNQESSLTPVRAQVKDLLQRLALHAKSQAERTLAAATMAMETGASRLTHAATLDPQNVLAIAQRLIDSGQHINFVRAAELGQMVSSSYAVPVAAIDMEASRSFVKTTPARPGDPLRAWSRIRVMLQRLKALWRRAPVLVLLLGWLLLGLIVGCISLIGRYAGAGPLNAAVMEIWGVGLLGLVVFQFFATLRNVRF